jgi:hypothetical protein
MVETILVLRWVWKLGFRQIGVRDELDLGEKDIATILSERNWEEDEEGVLCWRRRWRMGVGRDKQDVDEREIEKNNASE